MCALNGFTLFPSLVAAKLLVFHHGEQRYAYANGPVDARCDSTPDSSGSSGNGPCTMVMHIPQIPAFFLLTAFFCVVLCSCRNRRQHTAAVSRSQENNSMADQQLLTARNLLAQSVGVLEYYAQQGNSVALRLSKSISNFLWPEEPLKPEQSPTLESRLSGGPNRVENSKPTQCGESCGTVEGHGEGERATLAGSVHCSEAVGIIPVSKTVQRSASVSGYQGPSAGIVSTGRNSWEWRDGARITEDDGA